MSLLDLIALSLATWRITNLIVDDSEAGPWDSLHGLRRIIGVRYDNKNRPFGTNELARAMTCMWCASLWIALPVMLIGHFVSPAPLYPFALSAGALMVNKAVKR